MPETKPSERTNRWRKVSTGDNNVYIPLNVLIVVRNRKIIFGRIKSEGEAKATNVEGEGAVDGDGDGD